GPLPRVVRALRRGLRRGHRRRQGDGHARRGAVRALPPAPDGVVAARRPVRAPGPRSRDPGRDRARGRTRTGGGGADGEGEGGAGRQAVSGRAPGPSALATSTRRGSAPNRSRRPQLVPRRPRLHTAPRTRKERMTLLVVGSTALDTVETPFGTAKDCL